MKLFLFGVICVCITACKAQDNRELNVYLESINSGYFAIIYKKGSCNSKNQKLYFHIDSTGIAKTDECFVSSNIITKHHFYVKEGKNYKEIGYIGRGYKQDFDSLYVSGVESSGTEGWDFMIYRFGTLDELSQPITEDSKDLQEFEDKCVAIATRKN